MVISSSRSSLTAHYTTYHGLRGFQSSYESHTGTRDKVEPPMTFRQQTAGAFSKYNTGKNMDKVQ